MVGERKRRARTREGHGYSDGSTRSSGDRVHGSGVGGAWEGCGGCGAAHESEQEFSGEEYDRDGLEIPPRELPGGAILLVEKSVYRDLKGG